MMFLKRTDYGMLLLRLLKRFEKAKQAGDDNVRYWIARG